MWSERGALKKAGGRPGDHPGDLYSGRQGEGRGVLPQGVIMMLALI